MAPTSEKEFVQTQMNFTSRGSALYALFEKPRVEEAFDGEFCAKLAEALDAREVAIFHPDGDDQEWVCSYALGIAPSEARHMRYRTGEGLCGVAALTGQAAASHEPDQGSAQKNKGTLRVAVPILLYGKCACIIEILKLQISPKIHDEDLVLIQTFGKLYELYPEAETPPAPTPSEVVKRGSQAEAESVRAIGRSSAFTRTSLLVTKAARSDCPVLLLGETGTGKELIARQLHDSSRRASKPYVPINCAALSDTILESELFGHARGAFTGAYRTRKGKLDEADGGTVFLDEIAEMTPTCQAKLLRTLDCGEITPVGSNKVHKINVRFIAATHQDLDQLIQEGRFRKDLFYRLQGMLIELPPLRRRRGDMELLAQAFLDEEGRQQGVTLRGFSAEAMELMKEHDWPGNIRELKRMISQAVTLAEGEWIELQDLPAALQKRSGRRLPFEIEQPGSSEVIEERTRIQDTLRATSYPGTGRWNVRAAARELGMNRHTLAYKIEKVYKLRN